MKEFIISILMTVGIISPLYGAEPPDVDMGGLKEQEIIQPSEQPTSCKEYYMENDIILIAKTLYGECRGCSEAEQAKVAWCILNRVDDERFPNTIQGVITQPSQFHGYSESFPVCEQQYKIAAEVLSKWAAEKEGAEIERELPNTYCWFSGDGTNNYFREVY